MTKRCILFFIVSADCDWITEMYSLKMSLLPDTAADMLRTNGITIFGKTPRISQNVYGDVRNRAEPHLNISCVIKRRRKCR